MLGYGNDLDAKLPDFDSRLAMQSEIWDLGVMFSQACGQAGGRPTEPAHRLDGHEPVGDIGEAVGRSEALNLLEFDPFHQAGAGGAVLGVVGKMVDECVRIEE